MQLIVFAAFALVLSVPETGPPWETLRSPVLMWLVVAGQVIVPAIIGGVFARLVKGRLERSPSWLPSAQRLLVQGNVAVRAVLLGGFVASLYLTDFARRVNAWPAARRIWGLDEIVLLLPFFAAILASWVALYPADRAVRQVSLELRLWASAPARPVWGLLRFLGFMFRQHVLIIAVPMIPIVVANDFAFRYRRQIVERTGLAWADQIVLVLIAALIFLLAPVMLRYVWHTSVLPPGELRDRLEELCRRIGLTYRRILIWKSDGMVVNAAVMGLVRPVRYILLSDGLLEMMDDRKIEAVFGHEAGHVKHRHIQYYLLFAILSMLLVGGMTEGSLALVERYRPDLLRGVEGRVYDYLQMIGMALIVLVWAVGFGVVSRRFEWQADLFGARSVTPEPRDCDQPCVVHGTAIDPPAGDARGSPVCASAATLFADALERIAILNGIPIDARSWRHSSIANRMHLLHAYARDPTVSARLERTITLIKVILLGGTIVGLAVGVWLFWTPQAR